MPKKQEIVISKGSAYIYLKNLITLSDDFAEEICEIREQYSIKSPKYPKRRKNEGENAFDLRRCQYLELCKNPSKIYTYTPEVKKLCKDFFIPAEFYAQINKFLITNNPNDVLEHYVRSQLLPTKYEVPYVEMHFPFFTSKKDYDKAWKILQGHQKMLLYPPIRKIDFKNKSKVKFDDRKKPIYHLWKDVKMKDVKPFDRALAAYRLSKKYTDINQIIERLLQEKKISKTDASKLQGNKEVYGWIQTIKVQIESLKNFRILVEKRLI